MQLPHPQGLHSVFAECEQQKTDNSRTQTLSSSSHSFHARLTRFRSHGSELRVGRELRNWLRQILVERVAALLLNLAAFWRILVAMTIVQSWFLHKTPFGTSGHSDSSR